METGILDPQNFEDEAYLRPNGGRKLHFRSEVRRAGTPNLDTHVEIKDQAQASEVMEDSGTASSHLEVLSIIFKR